jgi:prophage tail gpP-like protein
MKRQGFATMADHQGLWYVYVDGLLVVSKESYQVASNLVDALNNPDRQHNTEAREVARVIRGA